MVKTENFKPKGDNFWSGYKKSILEPSDPLNQSLFQFQWNEVTKSITTPPRMGWQSITRLLPAFHRTSLTTIHQVEKGTSTVDVLLTIKQNGQIYIIVRLCYL